LDVAGAEEQFVAWPRQLGLAAQYFNVASPLVIGMENLLHQPVETLFDLKAHLQGTYPDISPYEEEQELLESMLSVVPDVKAETYTGTVLDTLDAPDVAASEESQAEYEQMMRDSEVLGTGVAKGPLIEDCECTECVPTEEEIKAAVEVLSDE